MSYKHLLILFISLSIVYQVDAQPRNEWRLFSDLQFDEYFNEDIGTYDLKPIMTDSLYSLEGREVVLLGYIISSSKTDDFENVILSKFPFTSCYFCGNAGMETVAEIEYDAKKSQFRMDSAYGFKGKLSFNTDNPERLVVILKEAEIWDF
jgi:hypothetical protein